MTKLLSSSHSPFLPGPSSFLRRQYGERKVRKVVPPTIYPAPQGLRIGIPITVSRPRRLTRLFSPLDCLPEQGRTSGRRLLPRRCYSIPGREKKACRRSAQGRHGADATDSRITLGRSGGADRLGLRPIPERLHVFASGLRPVLPVSCIQQSNGNCWEAVRFQPKEARGRGYTQMACGLAPESAEPKH